MRLRCRLLSFLTALAIFVETCTALQITNPSIVLTTGKPFTFQWKDANEPVRLELMSGQPTNLKSATVIAHQVTGGSYEWAPPAGLPSGEYVVKINDVNGIPNYTAPFQYVEAGKPSPFTATTSGLSSTVSSSSTSTSAPTTSTSSPNPSETPSAAGSNPQGLGIAALAGIGIGSAACAVGLVCAAGLFFYRRGMAAAERRGGGDPADSAEAGMNLGGKPELGGQAISELAVGCAPIELDAHDYIKEKSTSDLTGMPRSVGATVSELDGLSSPVDTAELDDGWRVGEEEERNVKYII